MRPAAALRPSSVSDYVDALVAHVRAKNPGEPEFHQAVEEVARSLEPVLERKPRYLEEKILDRLVEPERGSCSASRGSTTAARFRSTVATGP